MGCAGSITQSFSGVPPTSGVKLQVVPINFLKTLEPAPQCSAMITHAAVHDASVDALGDGIVNTCHGRCVPHQIITSVLSKTASLKSVFRFIERRRLYDETFLAQGSGDGLVDAVGVYLADALGFF